MSNKSKIVEKTCLLQDVWDESTRLQPLMLTLIDDLETLNQQTIFLDHFIDRIVTKNSSKNIILFGTNPQHFKPKSHSKIQILDDQEINQSDIKEFESKLISVATKNDSSNVLIIDSINPLFLIFDDDDHDDEIISRKFYQFLHRIKQYYQQIILIYHSMFDSSLEDSNESNIVYISNVIIDFRLTSQNKSYRQCCSKICKQNDDNSLEKTLHCHVITKKKHPRTHLQFDQKHEHIEIDSNSKIKFINQHNLMKQEKLIDDNVSQLPQSSFRLTLTKQEEEARENLVLPYVK